MEAKKMLRLALPLIAALILMGCESVKIADIKADPSQFRNKPVQVDGTVTTSFGALSVGAYEIEDETGKIFVITSHGVPSQGVRVRVQGTVFSGATVAGQAVGVAIRESKHEVR
ncbi:MAG: hypothetical protein A3H28_14565 [Acidobacteria bacterium RIFCSPLOWO2_02_FULL_61_28]|nr:MAG: hypothetical protein A3H28_14565 [Acidobacteria bacterium RIFCSPLOWO2_02_FULL_61_28]